MNEKFIDVLNMVSDVLRWQEAAIADYPLGISTSAEVRSNARPIMVTCACERSDYTVEKTPM